MGVFIIVNKFITKVKEKFSKFRLNRRIIVYGVLSILIIVLGIMYYNVNTQEEIIEINHDMITAQNEESNTEKKQGKLIYSVDNNAKVQNPFSFAHESENDIIVNTQENQGVINTNLVTQPTNEKQQKLPEDNIVTKQHVKQEVQQAINNCRLEAILQFNNKKIALMKINEISYRVRKGDTLEGFNVLDIGKSDVLLLSSAGDLVRYHLAGF